jgi:2,3-dihydroxy-2,3-dihydro-p-cumate dehydrogenase
MSTPPDLKTLPFAVPTQSRRYEGRVVIVTGGAQGIGRVIARRVAEEGASVVIADVQAERVARTARDLEQETGRPFLSVAGDLSRPGEADALIAAAIQRFGNVDTLVNNAAALVRMRLVDFTEELMQMAVDGTVWTTVRCCKAVLPHMIERGYGRIVNLAGEAWRTGVPYHTILAGVGKGAVVGLTATLAGETARQGITVNAVSPGATESIADGSSEIGSAGHRDPRLTPPEVMADMMRTAFPVTSIGRLAHPTEVAAAVAFLGSPEASYITGQHLGASGGMVML